MAGSRGWWTLAAWAVALATLAPLALRSDGAFAVAVRVHGSESAEVERILHEEFGSPFARFAVLVLEGAPPPDRPDGAALLARIRDAVAAIPGVAGTLSYLDLPDSLFLPRTGRGTFMVVGLDPDVGTADALIARLRTATATMAASPDGLALLWTGEAALNHDIRMTSSREAAAAEWRVLPITLGLLLLAFGALVAAALPVAAGFLAITVALGAAVAATRFMELSIVLENVTSMIGLGLGIDYGLLTVSRFREALAAGRGPRAAAAEARWHAGRTVAVSGLTVAIGFAALLVVPLSEIRSVAVGGLLVTLASVLAATTLLPVLLGLLGPRIDAGRLRRPRLPSGAPAGEGWRRWGRAVARRPLPVLLLAGAPLAMLASAAPRLSTELPRGDWLPAGMESARGLAALEASGGAGVVNTIRVLVPMAAGRTATGVAGWERTAAVVARVEEDPRVRRVQSLPSLLGAAPPAPALLGFVPPAVLRSFVSRDGGYALVEAVPREECTPGELTALVRDLRRGGGVLVGGLPALNVDYRDAVGGRFPLVIFLVVAATLAGLAHAFRSVVVPLKAVALNLLTVAASMGALVLVFQDGLDAGLLGAGDGTGGVFPAIPVLVFCTVFGLSMDYEVFLVARVMEARRDGAGEQEAIAEGLARTGGVITSAAAVMIAVFAAFTLGDFLLIRMLGFALAVAVLL
ncbi:MAG TPA: MMPL family transporter, partial [Longimicrobiales bacterium]|nr:MMPL family transporter [Longimicrobiales bacterium]